MAARNNINSEIQTFTQLIFCVKVFRFIFFAYSFLSFAFWFLNCMEADWLYMFNWLFIIPYQIVGMFYTPQGVSADFSLAIIGGASMVLGFLSDFINNIFYKKIVQLEEEEEKRIQQRRMQRQKKHAVKQLNKPAQIIGDNEMPTVGDPFEYAKLLFLILAHIKKIKRKKEDIDFTFQEIELWKQRLNKKLIENINYTKPLQKGYYRKNLFLVYKDFNYTDDFVEHMKPTLNSITLEFKKYGVNITFCHVLSSITDIQTLEKELDCMDTVLSLNFTNEFIVTNRFKITYDNKTVKKYLLEMKGEYNLSKNLAISNRQALFTLKEKN